MKPERRNALSEAEGKLGYKFKNLSLLDAALTHSSYANEHKSHSSYERLEFLGDSVLGMIVSTELIDKFPDKDEGFLTKFKSGVVSGATLKEAVERIGIIGYVLHGNGKASGEVVASDNVKEDVFEACVGAIMLDGGIDEARRFVLRELHSALNGKGVPFGNDFKSEFYEYAAKRALHAEIISKEADGGALLNGFVAHAYIDGELVGSGAGKSKKIAERGAASAALGKLSRDDNSVSIK